jgi:hypothetical protein
LTESDSKNSHRFNISLPVQLTKTGTRSVSQILITHNLSASRILMSCPTCPVEIGQEVEYFVSLPTRSGDAPVRLRCLGHVIRRDQAEDALAVSIERHEFVSDQPALRNIA